METNNIIRKLRTWSVLITGAIVTVLVGIAYYLVYQNYPSSISNGFTYGAATGVIIGSAICWYLCPQSIAQLQQTSQPTLAIILSILSLPLLLSVSEARDFVGDEFVRLIMWSSGSTLFTCSVFFNLVFNPWVQHSNLITSSSTSPLPTEAGKRKC